MSRIDIELTSKIDKFSASKSEADLKALLETASNIITENPANAEVVAQSQLNKVLFNQLEGMPQVMQNPVLKFYAKFADNEKMMNTLINADVTQLMICMSKSSDAENASNALDVLSVMTISINLPEEILNQLLSHLITRFNRKTHKSIVIKATKLCGVLFDKYPYDQLRILHPCLKYTLGHIDEDILTEVFKIIVNMSSKGCDGIKVLIENNFVNELYSQFRYPNVTMKKLILQLFTNIASCCEAHRQYVRYHNIKERLPAFLCHYDDATCMQCIDLLCSMKFSVQELIEDKYIITLILHVAMSSLEFQRRCYKIIRWMLDNANEKQVEAMVNEGFVRPFCSMLQLVNTEEANDILDQLLKIVERYNMLESKLCRFDFDHAHGTDNKSCVDQIDNLLKSEDVNLRNKAQRLLDYLKAKDIVMHAANEE